MFHIFKIRSASYLIVWFSFNHITGLLYSDKSVNSEQIDLVPQFYQIHWAITMWLVYLDLELPPIENNLTPLCHRHCTWHWSSTSKSIACRSTTEFSSVTIKNETNYDCYLHWYKNIPCKEEKKIDWTGHMKVNNRDRKPFLWSLHSPRLKQVISGPNFCLQITYEICHWMKNILP